MLQIFSKKEFLVDHLEGFVDIHNHILPGIDDGAKDVNDSIELIKGFNEFGVKNFICTPHIMSNYYENTPESIQKAFKKLKKEVQIKNLDDIKIAYSGEYMIDSNFELLFKKEEILPLKKNFLLVEMSYLQPSINFEFAIGKMKRNGLFPVLAHPERYRYYHSTFEKYEKLTQQNVLFQCNLLSFSGYYGQQVKKIAFKLLEKNLVHFLGSDVHNVSQLSALKASKLPKKWKYKIADVVNNTINEFY